ncbi:MAG TPA: phosphoribosylglycinamide formyltransferase, partial [Longimicrobiales bacterium]|nr:phosphoribosylglycinamide formyltransferase [Longimicrobiales bacterium]
MTRAVAAAVFASGSGTNFQVLLDREAAGGASWRTRLLVSDRSDAGALERARRAGVEVLVIPVKGREPGEVEDDTLAALKGAGIDVVFLAGYLRLIPAAVVAGWRRRILNIHPALLPAFGGKGMYGRRVHEAVLASGARVSGPTVHIVDERYDEGAILAQWPVPVRAGDTPESLAARVLAVEHRLYPLAADHLCRAVAGGREPGPLVLPGEAFSLVDALDDSGIVKRFQETFPTRATTSEHEPTPCHPERLRQDRHHRPRPGPERAGVGDPVHGRHRPGPRGRRRAGDPGPRG